MKYTCQIEINKDLEGVIALFDSEENLFKWQPELVSFEHLSGEKGEEGARSKLLYKMGKREVEMVETIHKKNFPSEFVVQYEAKGVWNEVANHFSQTEEGKTLWRATSHFKFGGFMKLMGWLMPGAFKKETNKYLNRFKEFAEAS